MPFKYFVSISKHNYNSYIKENRKRTSLNVFQILNMLSHGKKNKKNQVS